jgi:Protein of unknown function (DUF3300)
MTTPAFLTVPPKNQSPRPWRRAIALGLALLLVPFTPLSLFAQAPGQSGYPPPQANDPQQDYPPPPPDQQPYPNSPQLPYPQQPYDQQPPPQLYDQQPGYPDQDVQAQPQQALSPDQLDQLVAPIALDPDGLVAQILAAATFPTQIVEADHWRQSMGNAPPADVAAGADAQPWDPSVKSLTAFPQVLAELDQNLSWTTELGNAYFNQPQDVFSAIQDMRQRAQAAGNLQSTPQQTVSNDQGYLDIAPANPQVVYVPSYDPWNSYGNPVSPWPGFLDTLGSVIGGIGLHFGPGLVMSAFTAMPWGWLGWGLSWLGHCLFFDNEGYYPHGPGLRDWGLRYGGPRAPWGRNFAYARAYDRGFNRGYDRGGYGNRGAYDRGYGAHGGYGYSARGGYGYSARGGFEGRNAYGGRTITGTRGAYTFNGNRGYGNQRSFDNRGYAGNRDYAGNRNSFATRPGERGFSDNYQRSSQQAWNREPARGAYDARGGYGSSARASAGYGPGFYGRSSGNSFRQPQSTFRSAPNSRAFSGSSGFGRQSSRSYGGFSSKPQRSGGFFAGGHSSFGGGGSHHSFFGGGHSSFKGGGHSFGGGGHSFGGGGHSFHGGGHSGGGHSSSHGGGGHHH